MCIFLGFIYQRMPSQLPARTFKIRRVCHMVLGMQTCLFHRRCRLTHTPAVSQVLQAGAGVQARLLAAGEVAVAGRDVEAEARPRQRRARTAAAAACLRAPTAAG